MKTIHLIWILCHCAIIDLDFAFTMEPRYLVFSSTSQTWFSANQKCKTEYNGYLADIDEIREGSYDRKFTKCLNGSQELWTGEIFYTTDYILYKGCFSVRDSFYHNVVHMERMTIVICQLKCRYEQYFAIKGKKCKCIYSDNDLKFYSSSEFKDCSFIFSGQFYGFYGGNHTVSVYGKGQLPKQNNSMADGLCVINKCVKPFTGSFEVQYEKTQCDQQTKISAYCENGAEKKNAESRDDAMRFCVNQASNLATISADSCKYGLRVWQKERKYRDVIRIKGIITEDATISCMAINSSDMKGMQINSSDCHHLKSFVCVSDIDKPGTCSISLNTSHHKISTTKGILTNFVTSSASSHISSTKSDITVNNEAHVNITSSTSPDKHDTGNDCFTSGTGTLHIATTRDSSSITNGYFIVSNMSMLSKSKTSSNNTPIIVGVSVGLTCVIAVGALFIFIYLKRNGFGFCQPNQKTPKDNHSLDKLNISGNHARANAFGKTVEIDQNSNFDNDRSSEAGPAIYALPMRKQRTPEPETVGVDKETLDRAGSFHYDLAQPTGDHYDVNESYRESSTDDYYVTKAESDYDRLHQRRDKLRHQNVEDDYSHCLPGDDEYSYSRARDEGTRTNLDEDEYSHLASIKEEGFYDKCQR